MVEKRDEDTIYVTGNTGIDALKTTINPEYKHELFDWVGDDRLIMLTAHRRENLGEPIGKYVQSYKESYYKITAM